MGAGVRELLLREGGMLILGIDPGTTSGWCVYDDVEKRPVASGEFVGTAPTFVGFRGTLDHVVLERPVGQGATRPNMINEAINYGLMLAWCRAKWEPDRLHELPRYRIKSTLTALTMGEISCRNSRDVRQALVMLHGENSDKRARRKKGVEVTEPGALGRLVGEHEWAALAAAVAWGSSKIVPMP